eukprot:TRINITY_DN67251_c11_g3_i1.p1 TRINITY_DN67251_c11_g3~~TRINITY_DN67251_c11_g3_i1.p1  ORF type:complete len:254 (+),score=10.20 TRINITY_DN67251_c11_g3_i1:57-818(+)
MWNRRISRSLLAFQRRPSRQVCTTVNVPGAPQSLWEYTELLEPYAPTAKALVLRVTPEAARERTRLRVREMDQARQDAARKRDVENAHWCEVTLRAIETQIQRAADVLTKGERNLEKLSDRTVVHALNETQYQWSIPIAGTTMYNSSGPPVDLVVDVLVNGGYECTYKPAGAGQQAAPGKPPSSRPHVTSEIRQAETPGSITVRWVGEPDNEEKADTQDQDDEQGEVEEMAATVESDKRGGEKHQKTGRNNRK